MKAPLSVRDICVKIYEVMGIHGIKLQDLDEDGAVYYANGNDGTEFDWDVNNRLCEFMVYHKNGMGCIKANVGKNNRMTIFAYPHGELEPTKTYEYVLGYNAEGLKDVMLQEADNKGKWNKKLSEIFD